MKAQQRIDKVLEATRQRVQEEVGSLLGTNFELSDLSTQVTSKSDFFAEQTGKKVVAKIDINGEVEGLGGIVLSVKDAIRLGGTLIMLPTGELDEVSKSENYTEEIEDSYGEIANIVAGSYTKSFEDSFPKDCRFIRKEQDVVVPAKIDISSAEPFPDQYYYWVSSKMTLDGKEMGELAVLIPAVPFGIEVPGSEGQESEEKAEVTKEEISASVNAQEPASTEDRAKEDNEVEEPPVVDQPTSDANAAPTGKDLVKHKKLVDQLLESSKNTIGQEVGALLGVTVQLGENNNKIVTKEDFFQNEISGKHVLADMDVVGELEGKSYLFVSLKDAIRIGSTLIMLPPSELETAVKEEEFTEDAKDAYGEIANIISGAYTTVFQDQYTKSIRFIKKDIDVIAPLKIDCESDDLIPAQLYYLSSSSLEINGKAYGSIELLLPANLIGLQHVGAEGKDKAGDEKLSEDVGKSTMSAKTPNQDIDTVVNGSGDTEVDETAEVLIIENNNADALKIQTEIESTGISAQRISFKDSINPHLTTNIKLAIIVMDEVDEQAYGIAIKLRAMRTIPIVAAGSGWTRSKVIKAVKYGVTDILLTPSSSEDIREKINDNMLKMAA
jgi:chemotaxis protein CheY-P-specific phosphatase CheC